MRSTLSHIFLFLLHGKYAGIRTDEYIAQGIFDHSPDRKRVTLSMFFLLI